MRIINPQVAADLAEGRKLKLNLGAGGPAEEGYYAVDHLELPGVDIVADLNAPLDGLPDNCASHLVSRHCFEHIQNFHGLMGEIHRIVAPGGDIRITVPHFSNVFGFSDPTHVRFFGLYSMYYYVEQSKQPETRKVPAFYSELRYEVKSIRLDFYNWGTWADNWFGTALTKFFNKSMRRLHFYETRLSFLWPAWQITYEMTPDKPG